MLNIYLTDLAAYNKGFLLGEWVTLPIDQQQLDTLVSKILKGGEALCALEYGYEVHEEYFITDWEWEDISFFDIDEYDNLESLNETAELLCSLSPYQQKCVMYLMRDGIAEDIKDAIDKSDDVIVYENMSMTDIAIELVENCCDLTMLPTMVSNYINYEALARDLEIDGSYYCIDDDIFEYMGSLI